MRPQPIGPDRQRDGRGEQDEDELYRIHGLDRSAFDGHGAISRHRRRASSHRTAARYAAAMRVLVLCSFFVACAGAGRSTPSETPTGTTRRPASAAPPASGDDKERYRLNQQFEEMQNTQEAHREAGHDSAAPPAPLPPAAGSGAPGTSAAPATRPVKRGPAEQAPAAPAPAPRK